MDDQQNQDLTRAIILLEHVKEDIDHIRADISKIKDAVYDPDEGIYARLRSLETWKNTSTKIMWIMFTSIVGLTTLGIWQVIFPQLKF
jgi:hypothetical protein